MNTRYATVVVLAACVTSVAQVPAPNRDDWQIHSWNSGAWTKSDRLPEAAGNAILFARNGKRECIARTFEVDLDKTPVLEIVAGAGNCHWRLSAGIEGQEELLIADHQVVGTCRRNVSQRLAATARQRVCVRLTMWGWGGSDKQQLLLQRAAFIVAGADVDATGLGGVMIERHAAVLRRAETIACVRHAHPSLRYRQEQKRDLIRKARSTHALFARSVVKVLDSLAAEKVKPTYRLEGELLTKTSHAWREGLLQLHPPEPPELGPGQGGRIFGDARPESTWRVLCWHDFSRWVIGSALTDDPAFSEQAKRWILAMARWRFWQHPEYVYFDFATAYALQNFASGYDIANAVMNEAERSEVRAAIAQMAKGLYLSTLTGHGTIYNDLRGNHTAVTMCGLGLAGLVLLEEHPEAGQWAALAEQFMIDCFEEHTSGAWTESPSYGQYGIDEWLKLAEALRNVTGRDHMKHPFFTRYADFSLMIHDWEGRNLGYNGGGWASRWNHWIFLRIADELQRSDVQWLANFCLESMEQMHGYGDAFWWANPALDARRPTASRVGNLYDDIGLSVWRSGWEDSATILLHHCGRKGQHKEENMNHVTLYAKGRRMLPDGVGGRTADHNVPMIGGRKQNKWGPGRTPAFHSDERSGYSLGDATRAYGPRTLRHVLYLRSGVLVLVDDIKTSGRRPVEISAALHPQGDTALAGEGFRVDNNGVQMIGAFSDGLGQVLSPVITPRTKAKIATHDVSVTQTAGDGVRTISCLRFDTEDALPGNTMTVSARDGAIDFHVGSEVVRVGTAAGMIEGQISTTGALWVARLVNGQATDILAVASEPLQEAEIREQGKRIQGRGCVSWSNVLEP